MPKYDAFGREIGEDTLAGLGGGGGDASAAARAAPADGWTEAQVAEAAAAPPQPEAKPQPAPSFERPVAGAPVVRVRRRSGLGCLFALVVLIAIAAAPIVAIVGVVGEAEDTIDEITDAFDSAPDAEPVLPEPPAAPAQPPSGITGASMVAPANFRKAMARLDGMGRVTFIRLSPDRADAQLVKGSRQRSAQVDFEGELSRGPATPGASSRGAVAFSEIDGSAPARLVRGSAARFSVRARGIDYLVLMPWPGQGHRWIAYFKNGVYVEGDRNGKVVRRIS